VNSISLGAEFQALKQFLRKKARPYQEKCLTRTYVLVGDPAGPARVWGYISLVASEIATTPTNRPQGVAWTDTHHLPAVKLVRMAIDVELQGQGWGSQLIEFAIALVRDHVAERVAVQFLVTDAKASAVGFYSKIGFTQLDTDANKASAHPLMWIPVTKL
jgi:GNAT superfamily N-acetyltransferase